MARIETYKDIDATSSVLGASPWEQIKLLLDKLLELIDKAEMALTNENIKLKCEKIIRAQEIINYLQDCLNHDADKELTRRLDGIYNHLKHILFQANATNDKKYYKQAREIAKNLQTWWQNVKS